MCVCESRAFSGVGSSDLRSDFPVLETGLSNCLVAGLHFAWVGVSLSLLEAGDEIFWSLSASSRSGSLGAQRRIAKVTETFLTEVGVLLFVFPVLDMYVQNGRQGMTAILLVGSGLASFACYTVAAWLAAFTKEGED